MPLDSEQEPYETFDDTDITERDILIDDIWKVLRELPKTQLVEKAMTALDKLAKMDGK